MEATTVPPSSASPSDRILLMALDLSKATWVVAVAPPTSEPDQPPFGPGPQPGRGRTRPPGPWPGWHRARSGKAEPPAAVALTGQPCLTLRAMP